jgi:hypothetical protein
MYRQSEQKMLSQDSLSRLRKVTGGNAPIARRPLSEQDFAASQADLL